MREGDVIISINGDPVASVNDIHRLLTPDVIGKRLDVNVLREWANLINLTVVHTEIRD